MNRRQLIAGSTGFAVAFGPDRDAVAKSPAKMIVPPEEDRHERTFMQWPSSTRVHSDPEFLDQLQDTIADIANSIAEFEPVVMLAGQDFHRRARRKLSSSIDLWDIPTEDLWCRDSGPLFARLPGHDLVVSHIQFNGWGNRQINKRDSEIATRVAERLGLSLVPSGLVGEAGGVEHDGHGLLMAHESSWVHANRNPGLSRQEIEARLLAAYGADKMIWSPGVRDMDITDYHIDSLARFTGPAHVLINLPQVPDQNDLFHVAALETLARLQMENLEVEIIYEPEKRRVDTDDFVASYANYYVCNGGVIAAQFGDAETDTAAKQALIKAYPGRDVVMLNVDALGEIGGGIHCATQQMPKL